MAEIVSDWEALQRYLDRLERQRASEVRVPMGAAVEWPTAGDPPPGFLSGGSTVSRVLYPALFALYGTTFGAGDGSTTFGLPGTVAVIIRAA